MLKADAIIHNYNGVKCVARSCVNVRNAYDNGKTHIFLQIPMRDESACRAWLARVYPTLSVKVINHKA